MLESPRRAGETHTPPAPDQERLSTFEARHLAALVAVAQTRSFRLAGERLGYVQSAVSRQIATLEEVAGTRLVERAPGANEIALTQAGELLVRHAEALLARQAAARADLDRLAAGETGAVRIGVPQGIGPRVLRRVLATCRRRRLQTRVLASEFPTDAPLFELVEQGSLDLALASLPLAPGPFEHRPLLRIRWVLATPAHWSLAPGGETLRLADLAGRPLVGRHSERALPPLEAHLAAAGHAPNVVFRTDLDDTVRTLVGAGVGAGLLPTYGVDSQDDGIATHVLDDFPLVQSLAIVWHRERLLSPAAEGLRDVTCEVSVPGERARRAAAELSYAARP
ncbi:MAG TPA: LysR family transcriptional regulator [Conexibacter sp.]|nr:LysR family transcriptional regulator [Conexibacter sp.]